MLCGTNNILLDIFHIHSECGEYFIKYIVVFFVCVCVLYKGHFRHDTESLWSLVNFKHNNLPL